MKVIFGSLQPHVIHFCPFWSIFSPILVQVPTHQLFLWQILFPYILSLKDSKDVIAREGRNRSIGWIIESEVGGWPGSEVAVACWPWKHKAAWQRTPAGGVQLRGQTLPVGRSGHTRGAPHPPKTSQAWFEQEEEQLEIMAVAQNWVMLISEQHRCFKEIITIVTLNMMIRYQGVSYKSDIIVVSGGFTTFPRRLTSIIGKI